MSVLHKYTVLLVAVLQCQKIVCFCEESHVVICDDVTDIKNNDTIPWLHVQIGSLENQVESTKHVLNNSVLSYLPRTKFLTIINQIRLVTKLYQHDHIRYLNLYANNISEISDSAFTRMHLLREIYLKKNNIHHLGRSVFENLTLDIVDLSWNHIKSITTCFFNTKIKWLLLNNNKINFLESRPFPSSLEQLELNGNHLESIETENFMNLKKLKELYMENNRLQTIPNIVDLKQVQYLHFAYNNIQQVHFDFKQLTKLEFLDLSFNSIKNVTTDVFTGVKSAPLVVLSFNRLINVVFDHPEKKTDLVLYGNPWVCDCWFKIEKILSKEHHMKTCEFKIFDKGQVPLCIDGGKCSGSLVVSSSDADNYLNLVGAYQDDIKSCNFRL